MTNKQQEVYKAVWYLYSKNNGKPCSIERVAYISKFYKDECELILERLLHEGLISRVVTVNINNKKKYQYKPNI